MCFSFPGPIENSLQIVSESPHKHAHKTNCFHKRLTVPISTTNQFWVLKPEIKESTLLFDKNIYSALFVIEFLNKCFSIFGRERGNS